MHDHKASPLVQIAGIEPKPKPVPKKPHDHHTKFLVGLDVGSTTVKAVVVDQANDQILWSDYQRHDTKQPEKVLEFLKRFETEIEGIRINGVDLITFNDDGSRITHFKVMIRPLKAINLVHRLMGEQLVKS